MKFTREQVIEGAKAQYKKQICIASIDDAMREHTLENAILVILMDSCMWDSPSGSCFDTEHVKFDYE
jgi:hypothetical protein